MELAGNSLQSVVSPKLKLPDVSLKEELRAASKAVYEGMSLSVCLLATQEFVVPNSSFLFSG